MRFGSVGLVPKVLALVLTIAADGLVVAAQNSGALVGTVTANGTGIAGVTVRAFAPGGTQPAASATTGPDGAYTLALAQGVYRVEFSASAFETLVRPGVVVFADSTQTLNAGMRRAERTASGPETLPALRPGEVGVRLDTRFGLIMLAVDTAHAPATAANFLKYVDAGLYTGGRFHRATRPDNYTPALPNRPMMELIQGGINPDRRKEGFPPIPLERTSVTGLTHVAGTVSMARGTAADTATSDFFILLDDQPSLDFGGRRFDDGQGAAAFGRVLDGLSVVRRIQQQPAQGQTLTPPIAILFANRL